MAKKSGKASNLRRILGRQCAGQKHRGTGFACITD